MERRNKTSDITSTWSLSVDVARVERTGGPEMEGE